MYKNKTVNQYNSSSLRFYNVSMWNVAHPYVYFLFIHLLQNALHIQTIHNKYLNDSNPLKVGYIRIWGTSSTYVTQVTVTYDNQQFMEMNFKSDPYNRVCLKGMLLYHKLILLFGKVITTIIIVIFTYI